MDTGLGIWKTIAAAHATMKAVKKEASALMQRRPDIFGEDIRNLSQQPEDQPDDSDSVRSRVSALIYASDAIHAAIKTAKKTLSTSIVTATPYRCAQLEQALSELVHLCKGIGIEPRRQRAYHDDITAADLCRTIREALRQRKAAENAGYNGKVDSINAYLNDMKARIWIAGSKNKPVGMKDATAIAAAFNALKAILY